MNKKQKKHQSIVPGCSLATRVINQDIKYALLTWRSNCKDSDILLKTKELKQFLKPSVVKRRQKNLAIYNQKIKNLYSNN